MSLLCTSSSGCPALGHGYCHARSCACRVRLLKTVKVSQLQYFYVDDVPVVQVHLGRPVFGQGR